MCGRHRRARHQAPPFGSGGAVRAPRSRLAACGNVEPLRQTASPTVFGRSRRASPTAPSAQTPASEREHERILSSYGGAYDDPKLEALIGKTVDRLVAASDRPDQAYKVTILN